jgi:K+-sensing histidine kinase KdpD
MDFKFDILFKDASPADIDFSVSYIIRVDDLAEICKRYEQPIHYNSLSIIVEIDLRRQVRDLLLTLDKGELIEKELFNLIENQLKTKSPTVDIIQIKSFLPGRLTIKD